MVLLGFQMFLLLVNETVSGCARHLREEGYLVLLRGLRAQQDGHVELVFILHGEREGLRTCALS